MKTYTPEISWHNREPIFGVDIQKKVNYLKDSNKKSYRVATCGNDKFVTIWQVYVNDSQPKIDRYFNKKQHCDDEIVKGVVNDLLDQSASGFDDFIKSNDDEVMELQSTIQPSTSNQNDNEINSTKSKLKDKLNELDRPECVCTINHHIRAVNVCKFAPISDLIASGSDDQYIHIFEFKGLIDQDSEKERCNPFNDEEIIVKEIWKLKLSLRGHIEDVVDLSWSPDEKFIISGSIDNKSIIWDASNGDALYDLSKHSGYVQGVAWDPLNNYITTLCTDRYLRVFDATGKIKPKHSVKKLNTIFKLNKYKLNNDSQKTSHLFYDDTLATISRRLTFSPNGEFLACPSGIIELDDDDDSDKFINCVHLFFRNDFKKLHCYFPTGTFTNSISFCQRMFKLNPDLDNPYPFPYRLVFAIAAKDRVLIYDTQQPYPIAKISDIHYTRLSDLSWSIDGQILIASSTDGYCTFIYFEENELGERYEGEPYQFENLKEVEVNNKKSISSAKKKSKDDKKDENVANENVVTENKAVNKITNYIPTLPAGQKPSIPLLQARLTNAFTQSNNKNQDDDCQIIKTKDTTEKAAETIHTLGNGDKPNPIKISNIQSLVKKKPTKPTADSPQIKLNQKSNVTSFNASIKSFINDFNQKMQNECDKTGEIKSVNGNATNQYSQLNHQSPDKNNENSRSLTNNNNENSLRLKRGIEQNSAEEEPKQKNKKRVELIRVD